MQRYIVFDVETPNHMNNSISAIGVTVVEDGKICGDFYTLVDPEAEFDYFNVALTGITPEMVRGKPNFEQLWEHLEPVMSGGLLIAHNAPFDMSVLAKCIRRYCLDWDDKVPYACTCRMGRRYYPELPNHKLNTLCAYLGIDLDHHNAGSDSFACASVLLHCMDRGAEPEAFAKYYDMRGLRTLR